MKITAKTRYGMRFMIDLAQHYHEGRIALKDVAERQGISKKFLEQAVTPLVSAKLVTVARGQAGGYRLSLPPEDISLADVASASEDGIELLDCTSSLASCEDGGGCISRRIWGGLQQAMYDYLAGISLADAAQLADGIDPSGGHGCPRAPRTANV